MDVFSHGLWSATVAKGSNKFKYAKLSPWLAAWWGVFPDVFAFGIPMVWLVLSIINGSIDPAVLRGTHSEEPPQVFQSHNPLSDLAPHLYNISHSLVVFLFIFGLVFLIKKLVEKGLSWKQLMPWEMLAWLGHILCDIPTHTPQFYPTPIFWPISDWKFRYGFSWGQWWFMALDYGLLVIVFLIISIKKAKITSTSSNYDGEQKTNF